MQDDVELCHLHRSSSSLEMIRKYPLFAKTLRCDYFPVLDDQMKVTQNWLLPIASTCVRMLRALQHVEEGGKVSIANLLMVGRDVRSTTYSTGSDRCLTSESVVSYEREEVNKAK